MSRLRSWIALGLACALLTVALRGLQAQAGDLTYGQSVAGNITEEATLNFFTFEGAAGDLMIARIISLTSDLSPTLTLVSPTQEQLATSENNPANPSAEIRLSHRLEQDGVYTLVVNSATSSFGDYVLLLNGLTPASDEPLFSQEVAEIELLANAPSQIFTFPANPDAPTVLNISPENEGLNYTVEVYDPNGSLLAVLSGLPSAMLTIPAGDGVYLISVQSLGQSEGRLFIAFGDDESAGASGGGQALGGSGACTVIAADTGVNIRSGPGLGFGVIGRLAPGQSAPATGVNGGWYAITFENANGNVGWVGSSVVNVSGACASLPTVGSSPAVVTATPSPTLTVPPDDDDDDGDDATEEPTEEPEATDDAETTEEPEETAEATDNPDATPEVTDSPDVVTTPEVVSP
jgi:uncharacterized protein YraI